MKATFRQNPKHTETLSTKITKQLVDSTLSNVRTRLSQEGVAKDYLQKWLKKLRSKFPKHILAIEYFILSSIELIEFLMDFLLFKNFRPAAILSNSNETSSLIYFSKSNLYHLIYVHYSLMNNVEIIDTKRKQKKL